MVYKFFDKNSASLSDKSASGSGVANNKIKENLQFTKNCTHQSLEALKTEQFILDLKTIFEVLI